MRNDADLTQLIRDLEVRLLEPEVRSSAAAMDELLTDDFVEFGASGRVHDKARIVATIGRGDLLEAIVDDFEVRRLSPGTALATYRLRSRTTGAGVARHTLRSSLWVLDGERWRLRFHQGTLTSDPSIATASALAPPIAIAAYEPRFEQQCSALLATIPEWFGIPAANASYLHNLSAMPSWVALADSEVVGAITLELHFPESFEVHFLAVRRDHHRGGVGRALLAHLEREALARGARWLQVKTLAPSAPGEFYARTRAFYLAMGFSPLFESEVLFGDPRNPALVLVKPLGAAG